MSNPRKPDIYTRPEPDKMQPVDSEPQRPDSSTTLVSETTMEIADSKIYLPCYMTGFLLDIDRMNGMYRMPAVEPTDAVNRLAQFHSILEEECNELADIELTTENETKTQLADLLGDIIVYCASEAKRWNIPIDRVLNIIMQSNFSKLDSNGEPIYDERMKLQKGPNYWKPEPKIAALLSGE